MRIVVLIIAFVAGTGWCYDEEQALLIAIRDNSSENSVRLAYADWLDEHSRPAQAGLIRLSIAANNAATRQEREEILRPYSAATLAAENEILGGDAKRRLLNSHGTIVFDKGLIKYLELRPSAMTSPDVLEIVNRIPFAFHVYFARSDGPEKEAVDMDSVLKHMAQVRCLKIAPKVSLPMTFSTDGLQEALGLLDGVRSLQLISPDANRRTVGDEMLYALSLSPVAKRLKELEIVGGLFTPTAANPVATTGKFTALEALKFDTPNFHLRPFEDLSKLPRLRELEIAGRPVTDQFTRFLHSPGFLQLEALSIRADHHGTTDVLHPTQYLPVIATLKHRLAHFSTHAPHLLPAELVAQLDANSERLAAGFCFRLVSELSLP